MKFIGYLVIPLILSGLNICSSPQNNATMINGSEKLSCKIASDKLVYRIGELPEIKVLITNQAEEDIWLIGCLDGSAYKFRYPHCYYVEVENMSTIDPPVREDGVNAIREQDFVKVKSGESFDPFMTIDEYGFFEYPFSKLSFKTPGVYRLKFIYTSKASTIEDFMGYPGKVNDNIAELIGQVMKVELESNVLELQFVD